MAKRRNRVSFIDPTSSASFSSSHRGLEHEAAAGDRAIAHHSDDEDEDEEEEDKK